MGCKNGKGPDPRFSSANSMTTISEGDEDTSSMVLRKKNKKKSPLVQGMSKKDFYHSKSVIIRGESLSRSKSRTISDVEFKPQIETIGEKSPYDASSMLEDKKTATAENSRSYEFIQPYTKEEQKKQEVTKQSEDLEKKKFLEEVAKKLSVEEEKFASTFSDQSIVSSNKREREEQSSEDDPKAKEKKSKKIEYKEEVESSGHEGELYYTCTMVCTPQSNSKKRSKSVQVKCGYPSGYCPYFQNFEKSCPEADPPLTPNASLPNSEVPILYKQSTPFVCSLSNRQEKASNTSTFPEANAPPSYPKSQPARSVSTFSLGVHWVPPSKPDQQSPTKVDPSAYPAVYSKMYRNNEDDYDYEEIKILRRLEKNSNDNHADAQKYILSDDIETVNNQIRPKSSPEKDKTRTLSAKRELQSSPSDEGMPKYCISVKCKKLSPDLKMMIKQKILCSKNCRSNNNTEDRLMGQSAVDSYSNEETLKHHIPYQNPPVRCMCTPWMDAYSGDNNKGESVYCNNITSKNSGRSGSRGTGPVDSYSNEEISEHHIPYQNPKVRCMCSPGRGACSEDNNEGQSTVSNRIKSKNNEKSRSRGGRPPHVEDNNEEQSVGNKSIKSKNSGRSGSRGTGAVDSYSNEETSKYHIPCQNPKVRCICTPGMDAYSEDNNEGQIVNNSIKSKNSEKSRSRRGRPPHVEDNNEGQSVVNNSIKSKNSGKSGSRCTGDVDSYSNEEISEHHIPYQNPKVRCRCTPGMDARSEDNNEGQSIVSNSIKSKNSGKCRSRGGRPPYVEDNNEGQNVVNNSIRSKSSGKSGSRGAGAVDSYSNEETLEHLTQYQNPKIRCMNTPGIDADTEDNIEGQSVGYNSIKSKNNGKSRSRDGRPPCIENNNEGQSVGYNSINSKNSGKSRSRDGRPPCIEDNIEGQSVVSNSIKSKNSGKSRSIDGRPPCIEDNNKGQSVGHNSIKSKNSGKSRSRDGRSPCIEDNNEGQSAVSNSIKSKNSGKSRSRDGRPPCIEDNNEGQSVANNSIKSKNSGRSKSRGAGAVDSYSNEENHIPGKIHQHRCMCTPSVSASSEESNEGQSVVNTNSEKSSSRGGSGVDSCSKKEKTCKRHHRTQRR